MGCLLGALGDSLGVLGAPWGVFRGSWGVCGAFLGALGGLWGSLGVLVAALWAPINGFWCYLFLIFDIFHRCLDLVLLVVDFSYVSHVFGALSRVLGLSDSLS